MLNRIGYGRGQVIFVSEPQVIIGSAYTPPTHTLSEDEGWIQNDLLHEKQSHMNDIALYITLIAFAILLLGV